MDSRGILRGKCSLCSCPGFQLGGSSDSGLKCVKPYCGHPPVKHQNLNNISHIKNAASQMYYPTLTTSDSPAISIPGPVVSNSVDLLTMQPIETGKCKAKGCGNFCYYESRVGEFDYCSPRCRDEHLLGSERERLKVDLEALENKMRQSVSQGKKLGYGAKESDMHGTSIQKSDKHSTSIQESSSAGPNSAVLVSGRQKTLNVQFQKTRSKDIGLIVRDTSLGVLILGFECNATTEFIMASTSGKLNLLDVVTHVNDKKANSRVFAEEMYKSSFCSLQISRSIFLPSHLNPLLKKTDIRKPTHIVAVLNPNDDTYKFPSTKGFGLTVDRHNLVTFVTAETPARVSGLEFNDEVIVWGLIENNNLTPGKGRLTESELKNAAAKKKTLILLLNRKPTK